jgi:hypothetical protein
VQRKAWLRASVLKVNAYVHFRLGFGFVFLGFCCGTSCSVGRHHGHPPLEAACRDEQMLQRHKGRA